MRKVDHTRSRQALFWGLGAFAALQVGLSALIALAWPELRDPLYFDKSAPLKARTVGVHPAPLTVLTLGTSRMDVGMRTRQMEEQLKGETPRPLVVYNFGVSGAGPLSRLVFLRRLLADGVKPDLVFLEVLPATLSVNVEANEFVRLPGSRLSWDELDIVRRYDGPTDEAFSSWLLSWLVPWYQHRFVVLAKFEPTAVARKLRHDLFKDIDPWGQRPDLAFHLSPDQRRKAVEDVKKEYKVRVLGKTFRLSRKLTDAYREILETCRREGISAVVVCMPEGPTFQSWYSPDARAQIQAFLTSLRQEFNVPVVECRDWSEEGDFRDSHHLMLSGAERFSRRFGEEVMKPGIRERTRALAKQKGGEGQP